MSSHLLTMQQGPPRRRAGCRALQGPPPAAESEVRLGGVSSAVSPLSRMGGQWVVKALLEFCTIAQSCTERYMSRRLAGVKLAPRTGRFAVTAYVYRLVRVGRAGAAQERQPHALSAVRVQITDRASVPGQEQACECSSQVLQAS
jgi:hypothetical protein